MKIDSNCIINLSEVQVNPLSSFFNQNSFLIVSSHKAYTSIEPYPIISTNTIQKTYKYFIDEYSMSPIFHKSAFKVLNHYRSKDPLSSYIIYTDPFTFPNNPLPIRYIGYNIFEAKTETFFIYSSEDAAPAFTPTEKSTAKAVYSSSCCKLEIILGPVGPVTVL